MKIKELKAKRQKIYNLKLEQRKFLPAFEEFFDKSLKEIRRQIKYLTKG